jgi:hypothetical protein
MKTLLIAFVSLMATAAMAKSYSDAGCGLGLQVIGKEGNQILAATLNTTGIQTFAISSGTSGCVDDGAMADNKQVPAYIEMNKVALAKDAARGEGETLAGLAQLMGCSAQTLAPAMKSNYNQIFVETNMQPEAIETQVRTLAQAQACGA